MTNVSDNFNRAGPGLGSNWTTASPFTDLEIASSTKCRASITNSHCVAYWSANTFQNDQFAEATRLDSFGGTFVGPTLRHQAGTQNFYVCYCSQDGTTIYKWRDGVAFLMHNDPATTWADGTAEVIRFEAVGNTLSVYKNGVITGAVVTDVTDLVGDSGAPYTSGSPGINIYSSDVANGNLDNWSAGPLTATTTTVAVDGGSFVKSGQNVAFALRSPAARGTFALNGQSIVAARHLPIARGSFALTGKDVEFALLFGASVAANVGDFMLTGQATGQRILCIAGVGDFVLDGQNVFPINTGLSLRKRVALRGDKSPAIG